MDQATVIAKLREREAELRVSGILHLSLFGSKARGDDTFLSDVDLIADYNRAKKLTLFDKAGLEVELAEILKARVDLCDREMLEDPVRLKAEQEAVLVF